MERPSGLEGAISDKAEGAGAHRGTRGIPTVGADGFALMNNLRY